MVNIESVRRLLATADVAKDPYAVAEVAGEFLTANDKDPVATAAYGRALVTLKLFGAVQRLLGAHAASSPDALASNIIPWESRARRFAANLLALEARDPAYAALVRAAAVELPRYELHQAADGNFHILDTTLPVYRGWLTGFADHKAAEKLWPADAGKPQLLQPIVFEAFGFGWLLLHALKTTETTFLHYRCPFYILERDPLSLAMLMHLHDLRELFASSRVRLFLAESADDTLRAFQEGLLHHPEWTIPGTIVRNSLRLPASSNIDAALAEVRQAREQRKTALVGEINAYYADKTPPFWRERFSPPTDARSVPSPPLRVLGITSRYTTVLQYSMAELQQAVHSVGDAEMRIAIEPNDESLESPFLEMIADFKPDLIVQISRMRYEHPLLPANVPFLCWDQDNLPCMRPPATVDPLQGPTFVAGHGALFGCLYLKWPMQKCIVCHPTGMTHRYRAVTAEATSARYRADMSYVSHASASPEQLRESLADRWRADASSAALFAAASEKLLAAAHAGQRRDFFGLRHLAATTAAEQALTLPDQIRDELVTSLALLSDRAFRHQTLAWAARWCESRNRALRLWGNGWNNHPTLAKYAGGAVLPGDEAATVYRATTLNLQIIETGVLHSRVLDGWSTGGFFLVRQSIRPEDEAKTLDLYHIGQLTQPSAIHTIADLEQRGSDRLRNLWHSVASDYREFSRDAIFPGFAIWQQLPPASVLLPTLSSVLFSDEVTFAAMADRYIDSPADRAAAVDTLRDVLEKKLSYDSRWRDFRRHIAQNL